MSTSSFARLFMAGIGGTLLFFGVLVGFFGTVTTRGTYDLNRTVSCGSPWSPESTEMTQLGVERCASATTAMAILAAALVIMAALFILGAVFYRPGRFSSTAAATPVADSSSSAE